MRGNKVFNEDKWVDKSERLVEEGCFLVCGYFNELFISIIFRICWELFFFYFVVIGRGSGCV